MDSDELSSLVRYWQPRIRAFFSRRCRCREDAEDLAQEAIAAVIRCFPAFAHRSSLSTWIYAVCRNTFSNFVYYRQRDARLVRRLQAPFPEGDADLAAALRSSVDGLRALEKSLYTLYYVEGRSIRETALALHRPEGTVKYLLYRLRSRVRESLEP